MWHYIHHIIFDPLSWWERAKLDLFIAGSIIGLIGLPILALAAYETVRGWFK